MEPAALLLALVASNGVIVKLNALPAVTLPGAVTADESFPFH